MICNRLGRGYFAPSEDTYNGRAVCRPCLKKIGEIGADEQQIVLELMGRAVNFADKATSLMVSFIAGDIFAVKEKLCAEEVYPCGEWVSIGAWLAFKFHGTEFSSGQVNVKELEARGLDRLQNILNICSNVHINMGESNFGYLVAEITKKIGELRAT